MKEGWTEVALGDLALQMRDGPFGSNLKSSHYVDEGVRVVRLQNIGVGHFLDNDLAFITEEHFRSLPKHHCAPGDLLVATLGVPNVRACILPDGVQRALNKADCIQLRCDLDRVEPRYVMHAINSYAFQQQAATLAHGQTRVRVSMSQLRQASILLPPLEEQRRIAAILDKADQLRAKRRAALAHLDTLTQAIFLDMFGDPVSNPKDWEIRSIGDVTAGIDSGSSPVCLKNPADPGTWGVLKLGAVTTGQYLPSQNKQLPPLIEPDVRNEVRSGDVLFARKNTAGLVGACTFAVDTPPRMLLSDLIFRLRLGPTAPILGRFLAATLQSPRMRSTVRNMASGAAGSMPNISKRKLGDVRIQVPPMRNQRAFEMATIGVEHMRSIASQSRMELDELFASLQARAFRGEL